MATGRNKQIERIKRELSFIRREADRMEDFEAADALQRSLQFILGELEDFELRQLPETDDLPGRPKQERLRSAATPLSLHPPPKI